MYESIHGPDELTGRQVDVGINMIPELDSRLDSGHCLQRDLRNNRSTATPLSD